MSDCNPSELLSSARCFDCLTDEQKDAIITELLCQINNGGGVGGSVDVQDEGSSVVNPATILNFEGSGVSVADGGGGEAVITIPGGGGSSMPWTVVTGASQAMSVNNGYIENRATSVTFTLPATSAVGDIIEVTGIGAGGWIVAQNAGQTIHFGVTSTTTGASGSISSTLVRDSIRMVCVVANNDWNVISSIGNLTVV